MDDLDMFYNQTYDVVTDNSTHYYANGLKYSSDERLNEVPQTFTFNGIKGLK